MATVTEQQDNDARRVEFERVMNYVTERAWTDGLEEEVMAALFDVLDSAAQGLDSAAQGQVAAAEAVPLDPDQAVDTDQVG